MGDSSRMGRMTMPQINQFTLFILTICALSAAALPSTQSLYEQQHKLYSDLVAPKLDKEWIDVNEFAQEAAERTFPEFTHGPTALGKAQTAVHSTPRTARPTAQPTLTKESAATAGAPSHWGVPAHSPMQ